MTKVTVNRPEVVLPPPTITIELSVEEAFFLRSLIPCLPQKFTSDVGDDGEPGIMFPLWVALEPFDDSEWPYNGPLGPVYNKMEEINKAIYADFKTRTYLGD